MRIIFVGFRGFPGVQGGVESHCQNLCPRLVELGCDVTIIARSSYQKTEYGSEWCGIKIKSLWAPKSAKFEAIVHSFLAVIYAGVIRPDILHIHAIGPSIMVPLARLLGLRVVVTHHGHDYRRPKWGALARFLLRAGEFFAARFSSACIVITGAIAKELEDQFGARSVIIPNGVDLPSLNVGSSCLAEFGVEPGKYILTVGRLVPEKCHNDIFEAFLRSGLTGWSLVIVGAADFPTPYSETLLARARANPDVKALGYQGGLALRQLYANAGMFVLASSHEGLPIALLEALSYGVRCLASDIDANLAVGLERGAYFRQGDVNDLSERLSEICEGIERGSADDIRGSLRALVAERFNWTDIALRTLGVYKSVLR